MKVLQPTKLVFTLFALAFALLQPSWACPTDAGCTKDSNGSCKCPPGGVKG